MGAGLALRLRALIRTPSVLTLTLLPWSGLRFSTSLCAISSLRTSREYILLRSLLPPYLVVGMFLLVASSNFFAKLPSPKKPAPSWKKLGFLSFPCPCAPFKRLVPLLYIVFPNAEGIPSAKSTEESTWGHESPYMKDQEKETLMECLL